MQYGDSAALYREVSDPESVSYIVGADESYNIDGIALTMVP
jgi:hypothetical protein